MSSTKSSNNPESKIGLLLLDKNDEMLALRLEGKSVKKEYASKRNESAKQRLESEIDSCKIFITTLFLQYYLIFALFYLSASGRWTPEEHKLFLDGLRHHGKGWKKIAAMVSTRSVIQVRTHAQKYFQRLSRSKVDEKPTVLVEKVEKAAPKKVDVIRKRGRKPIEIAKETTIVSSIPIKRPRHSNKEISNNTHLNIDVKVIYKDASCSTPSPSSIADHIIESGNIVSWESEELLDDWFLNSAHPSSPFTSTDSHGSSLSGEDDFDSCSRDGDFFETALAHSGQSDTDLSSPGDFFDEHIDEDTFVSGILEMFDM